MVGLISLEKNFGGVEVAATDTADHLGQEVKSAFLGGEIREGKTSVRLDDPDGGEQG